MKTASLSALIEQISSLPPWTGLLLVLALIVGSLVLGVMGAVMSRWVCAIGGMLMAVGVGAILHATVAEHQPMGWWLGGSAVVGAAVAALMYRLWMAILLAVLLTATLPSAVISFERHPAPPIEPVRTPAVNPQDVLHYVEAGEASLVDQKVRQAGQEWRQRQGEALAAWWAEMAQSTQMRAVAAAVGGALGGLLLGVLLPRLAAAIASATLSVILLTVCVQVLLFRYAPNALESLRAHERPLHLALACLAGLSVIVQMLAARNLDDGK